MSIPLNVNGAVFEYPVDFDENWGVDATGWAQAVTNGMLQMAGGNFPLTADANFGPNFGLVSLYYKSHSASIATAGVVRLAKGDTLDWRNNADSSDNSLSINSSDQLLYNGVVIGAAAGVTSITGTANEIIASSSTGAITLSTPQPIAAGSSPTFVGLTLTGLTASTALTTNGSNVLTSSPTTSTELSYVNGVTSAIQTQLNGKLSLSGGTMSGPIAMGSNKVTGVTQGTTSGDAISFPVAAAQISSATITATQVASNTLTGSTANSGGSAGNVAQGTISTPDFRTNAVTNIQSSVTSTSFHGTDITTITITTIGKPVLLVASASLSVTPTSGPPSLIGVSIDITRDTTGIVGGEALENRNLSGTSAYSGNQTISLGVTVIDTPTAGTYTYRLSYTMQNGSFSSAPRYSLQAIELRA